MRVLSLVSKKLTAITAIIKLLKDKQFMRYISDKSK